MGILFTAGFSCRASNSDGSLIKTPLDSTSTKQPSHFVWGADLGSSIDLTGHDLSTFDLDLLAGYRNKYIKMVGMGIGFHRTVQGGSNFIPIYALIRTSFTSRPSLLFFHGRIGYSFNTIEHSPMFGDFSSTIGLGINLSQSRKVNTYFVISGGARYYNKRHQSEIEKIDTRYIWIAQLQFGVNF